MKQELLAKQQASLYAAMSAALEHFLRAATALDAAAATAAAKSDGAVAQTAEVATDDANGAEGGVAAMEAEDGGVVATATQAGETSSWLLRATISLSLSL